MSAATRLRSPAVDCRVRDGIAWLTLDRPGRGNALDAELLGDLAEACASAEADDDVRVLVLAAAGRTFSSGLPRTHVWPDPSWADGVGRVAESTSPGVE